ncbi:MAG: SusD/RagB family nutrient-binding outer membrane lipoprotein [Bacteroidota bacterium]
MKFKQYSIAFATLLLVAVGGCKKELDINTDPNNAADVEVVQLLPPAQAAITYAVGNTLQIYGGLWSQYWTQNPAASQYRTIEQYNPDGSNFDNVWINLNADALEDLERIIDKSKGIPKLQQYEAIATLLKVYTFQLSTDLFGDIPYTEALKGDKGILNPKYDTQESVYDNLFILVDHGISLIDVDAEDHPGDDDLIYQGDMEKWLHFGNTLKLKLALRIAKVKEAKARAVIATLEGEDFIQSGESAQVKYTSVGGGQNPLYSAIAGPVLSGTQNLVASNTGIGFFNTREDPRVEAFYQPAGGAFVGIKQGDYATIKPGTPISIPSTLVGADANDEASALAPVKLISDYEAKFLQAEAVARGWLNTGNAKELYNAGIVDNFVTYGIDTANIYQEDSIHLWKNVEYFYTKNDVAFPDAADKQIEAIITQKWAAMNGNQGIEAWIEWRRTGYPSFFVVSAASNIGPGRVPKIFLYPTEETTKNSKTPPQHKLDDRVWWDTE